MAGGKGTRLKSVASDIPKPMMPVSGKPVLEYQIESLKKSGITDVILIVGHLGDVIKDYFGNGEKFNININYITEDKPLGTAGALFYLKEQIDDDFVLVFGDLMLDIDWNRFMDFHRSKSAHITLYGHPNSHPYDSDVIVVDTDSKVIDIEPKSVERDFYYNNFVNAGVYCVSPKILRNIKTPEKIDLEKTIISEQISLGSAYAYKSTEYVKDMGTPDRLESVTADVENGVVESRNLRNKQKCVFLDRDGTVNVLKGFLNSAEQFELLPKVASAIKLLNKSTYLTIIATNQPVIARGECTFDELSNIHKKLETLLGENGAYIDDLFFCPHHPHSGYEGEIKELKFDCNCRKPKTGMIEEAAKKYNIDLSESWYIGDTTMDIQTGKNAGMKTILLNTGEGGKDKKYDIAPDYLADDLLEAVELILNKE